MRPYASSYGPYPWAGAGHLSPSPASTTAEPSELLPRPSVSHWWVTGFLRQRGVVSILPSSSSLLVMSFDFEVMTATRCSLRLSKNYENNRRKTHNFECIPDHPQELGISIHYYRVIKLPTSTRTFHRPSQNAKVTFPVSKYLFLEFSHLPKTGECWGTKAPE